MSIRISYVSTLGGHRITKDVQAYARNALGWRVNVWYADFSRVITLKVYRHSGKVILEGKNEACGTDIRWEGATGMDEVHPSEIDELARRGHRSRARC